MTFFFGSIILAIGSSKVIDYNREYSQDCEGMRGVVWTSMLMHAVNSVFCLINLAKLETKLCFFNLILFLGIAELIAMAWLQWGYFNA